MVDIEKIKIHLAQKIADSPADMCVLSPENKLPSQLQADWLISLLQRIYISHGITRNCNSLIADISQGLCTPWFALDNGVPVACAALVSQSDGSVELGRAVSLKSPGGSLVMLSAAIDHLQKQTTPLVAEVRVAAEFLGIPSGAATQKICLDTIGLTPHAFVPAFGHGEPFREEPFIFAESGSLPETKPVFLPSDRNIISLLSTTAIALARAGIAPDLSVHPNGHFVPESGWQIVTKNPFAVVIPSSDSSTKLETAIKDAEEATTFTLIPLEASSNNSPLLVTALNAGFIPCGIDRNPGQNEHPVILFGKLRPNTLLAPTSLNSHVPDNQRQPMQVIDSLFRSPLLK